MSKQKLKIGFLFDDSLDSNDGVSQYVKALGSWLTAQGHSVRYLVGQTKMSDWDGGTVYSMAKNVKVTFNGNQAHVPLPAKRSRIKQVLLKEDFDVLHVQVPYSPFMAQMVMNRVAKKTAIVGTFHVVPSGLIANWGAHLLPLLHGRSLRRFDKVVSVSAPAAKFARSAFGLKTEILPNAVNIKKFAPYDQVKKNTNSKRIVFLGRLVKRKGCKELLLAFAKLIELVPDARLVIGGDGPQRKKLESLAKKQKLADSVKFLGYINEDEKPALLASADIACFPSLGGESFGIVLIEAMAAEAGVVLGGNNPGYGSVLAGRPELLVDPKNTKEFTSKLQQLLGDKKKATEFHSWQQAEVRQYSVDNIGQKLVDIYFQAIAKRRKIKHT